LRAIGSASHPRGGSRAHDFRKNRRRPPTHGTGGTQLGDHARNAPTEQRNSRPQVVTRLGGFGGTKPVPGRCLSDQGLKLPASQHHSSAFTELTSSRAASTRLGERLRSAERWIPSQGRRVVGSEIMPLQNHPRSCSLSMAAVAARAEMRFIRYSLGAFNV